MCIRDSTMDYLQNVMGYFDQQQPLCAQHDKILSLIHISLQSLLAERRKEITLLPTLSLGSAVFSGEDVVTVKDLSLIHI